MSDSPTLSFESLGLPAPLLATLTALGYREPTPVQAAAIPPLLEGRDVLGQAATGTGKTAAFALPMLARIEPGTRGMFETSALVLVPTRELALQVTEAVRRYGASLKVSAVAVYGGEPIGNQLKLLKRGVDVVIATPGRALDHLDRKSLKLNQVKVVVLDEADEMLDMGFEDDLKKILGALPAQRQTALFSATMPPRIQKIAERHLKSPVRVAIRRELPAAGEAPRVRQIAYVVAKRDKVAALVRVLQAEDGGSALVFCRTRADVDELAALLPERGLTTEALHGGLDQNQRDRVMKRFKSGSARLLIATDVAARGLDIDHLSLVVNYEVPTSPEVYVHRIGRTGRAGREGVAITLVEPGQVKMIKGLEKAAGGTLAITPVPTATNLVARRLLKSKTLVLEAAKTEPSTELLKWIEASGVDAVRLAAAAIGILDADRAKREPIDESNIPNAKAKIPTADVMRTDRPAHHDAPRAPRPSRAAAHKPAHAEATHSERPAPRASRPAAADEHPRSSRPAAANEHPRASSRPAADEHPRASRPAAADEHPRASSRPAAVEHPRASRPAAADEHPRASSRPAAAEHPRASRPAAADEHPRASRPAAASEHPRPSRAAARSTSPEARSTSSARPNPRPSRAAQTRTATSPHRGRPDDRREGRFERPSSQRGAEKVALYVGAGNAAGIRPADLVGAIANEADIDSKQIGPIQVKDLYSLVGVPANRAEAIILALRNTKLRGRKVEVRRER